MNCRLQTILSAAALAGTTLLTAQTLTSLSSRILDNNHHSVVAFFDGQPVERRGATIDSSEYLCASQSESNPIQFHLEGVMECFGGDCAKNGEPRISDGAFSKTYWINSTDGVRRFVNMKAPNAPSEFFAIRGNDIYLEEEVMTWNPYSNNEYRDHHDANGNPNHLWAKTNDVENAFVSPNIGDFFWRYCDKSQPDDFVNFHDGGYFVLGPYNLTKSNIRDLDKELAQYGTGIDPGWLNFNVMFDKPTYDVWVQVRVNRWGPFGASRNNTPLDWAWQETYWYGKLKEAETNNFMAIGFLRWNEASHEKPGDPLFMDKQGTVNRVVQEQKPLRALELCQVLSKSVIGSAQDFLRYDSRKYLNINHESPMK